MTALKIPVNRLHIRIDGISLGLLEHVPEIDGYGLGYGSSSGSTRDMSVHHLPMMFPTSQGTSAIFQMTVHHAHMVANGGHGSRDIGLQIVEDRIRLLVSHHLIAQRGCFIRFIGFVQQPLDMITDEAFEFALH